MIEIPGYTDAVAEERRDRAFAFLGQQDTICGVPVHQMTPIHWEWFRATDNPFVCGGHVNSAHALHALWMLSVDFKADAAATQEFTERHLTIDVESLYRDLDAYMVRMFLDAPYGKEGLPYYSAAAGMVHGMAEAPYNWDTERTLRTPLPIIFQLLKAKDRAAGIIVINRKSDKVRGDWLDVRQQQLDRERKRAERRARRERPNGSS